VRSVLPVPSSTDFDTLASAVMFELALDVVCHCDKSAPDPVTRRVTQQVPVFAANVFGANVAHAYDEEDEGLDVEELLQAAVLHPASHVDWTYVGAACPVCACKSSTAVVQSVCVTRLPSTAIVAIVYNRSEALRRGKVSS
jgi:hypothetical protein